MKRIAIFTLILLFGIILPAAVFAEEDIVPYKPIEVIESSLGREGFALVPEDGVTFIYNGTIAGAGRIGGAPDNLMHYELFYTMAEPKESCLIRIVLTGPGSFSQHEIDLPMGDADGEENHFMAIMLAMSDEEGEYVLELYIDDVLCDIVVYEDE